MLSASKSFVFHPLNPPIHADSLQNPDVDTSIELKDGDTWFKGDILYPRRVFEVRGAVSEVRGGLLLPESDEITVRPCELEVFRLCNLSL